jgi:hypothetical protein
MTDEQQLRRQLMTLNPAQFEEFVCNYVQHIVDGLDTESLECMVSDLLFKEYQTYTEEQIVNEITDIYGEEYAQNLLESVTDVPVA